MNEKAKKFKGDLKIAGNLTVDDWDALKKHLICGKPDNWKLAYNSFFLTRIQTRYFDPIETLIKQNDKAGEGFSIVALQCSLIEFLASTVKGVNYKHVQPIECDKCDKKYLPTVEPNSQYYCSSAKLFTDFLSTATPFEKHFTSKTKANEFYEKVRCALLHEARTKGRWRILKGGKCDPPIDMKNKIVYRNKFQSLFIEFIEGYGEKLPHCKKLQEGFKTKFDGLCVE